MKQILYSILAFLGVLSITSCSNDDILIETSGKTHTLTLNVSTQAPYDTFETTDIIRENYLRNGHYEIAVTSFVYNSSGSLVEALTKMQPNFNMASLQFNLVENEEYTIITIETLFDADVHKSLNWDYKNIQNIETLNITQKKNWVYPYYSLAVNTSKVKISSDQYLSITPTAIGSILNVYYYNYDLTEYPQVGFGTTDILDYYLLDPSISEENRYHESLASSGYTNLRVYGDVDDRHSFGWGCYILEPNINWKFYVVKPENVDAEKKWTPVESGSTVLRPGETYYGCMYYTPQNNTSNTYLGSYEGLIEWMSNLLKEDETIPDVYTSWGGSVKDAQDFMTGKGYIMNIGTEGKAIYVEGADQYQLQYTNESQDMAISYFFSSETTGLYETDIMYLQSEKYKNLITSYLNKNFEYNATKGYYESADKSTVAMYLNINSLDILAIADANVLNANLNSTRCNGSDLIGTYVKSIQDLPLKKRYDRTISSEMNEQAINLFEIEEKPLNIMN